MNFSLSIFVSSFRSLKQIFSHEPQKDEIGGFHQQASKNTSLTGSYGRN